MHAGSADELDVHVKSCERAVQGFPEKAMNKLEDYGFIQSRPRGEYHANNQQMSKLLHKAIGLGNKGAAPQVRFAHAAHLITTSFRTVLDLPSRRPPSSVHLQHPGLLHGHLARILLQLYRNAWSKSVIGHAWHAARVRRKCMCMPAH